MYIDGAYVSVDEFEAYREAVLSLMVSGRQAVPIVRKLCSERAATALIWALADQETVADELKLQDCSSLIIAWSYFCEFGLDARLKMHAVCGKEMADALLTAEVIKNVRQITWRSELQRTGAPTSLVSENGISVEEILRDAWILA